MAGRHRGANTSLSMNPTFAIAARQSAGSAVPFALESKDSLLAVRPRRVLVLITVTVSSAQRGRPRLPEGGAGHGKMLMGVPEVSVTDRLFHDGQILRVDRTAGGSEPRFQSIP